MQLQKSPNRWSCLPTAFAIVLGIPVQKVIEEIGHDGSEIAWPALPEPQRRIGFHIQELIDLCYSLGYTVTPFQALPHSKGNPLVDAKCIGPSPEKRMEKVLTESGVITGVTQSNSRHAVAWNGNKVYDPNGTTYEIEKFMVETFWMVRK